MIQTFEVCRDSSSEIFSSICRGLHQGTQNKIERDVAYAHGLFGLSLGSTHQQGARSGSGGFFVRCDLVCSGSFALIKNDPNRSLKQHSKV